MNQDKVFINGEYRVPRQAHHAEVVEAATGEVFAQVALAGPGEIDEAVDAASQALRGPWSELSNSQRADLMDRFADELLVRRQETSTLVSRENGMPITLSKSVNGFGAAVIIKYYAELIRSKDFEEIRTGPGGTRTLVQNGPVGVVAAITPWNYPQPLAAMKIGPALAAGCSIVLKPAVETALDAYAFAEAAIAAGLPAGVLNVVPGDGEVGAYLAAHPGVDKAAFTGSTGTGRKIAETNGRLLRPSTLELGGKSVSLALDDVDIDLYTANLLEVSMPNNGQTCHAGTRILAPQSRYEEIVDAVTSTVGGFVVGDPLDKSTEIGPLVSAAQRDKVLDYIEAGKSSGARLTTGGGIPDARNAGWFVSPTVFADVDNSHVIAQEEIFGPVLTVTKYHDVDEAILIANDSRYGLGGSVWTQDESRGLNVARRIRSGTVGVNHYTLDTNAPFGGVKESGVGRELGPEGLAPYLETKSIYLPQVAS